MLKFWAGPILMIYNTKKPNLHIQSTRELLYSDQGLYNSAGQNQWHINLDCKVFLIKKEFDRYSDLFFNFEQKKYQSQISDFPALSACSE